MPRAPKHCKMASSKFFLLLASSAFLCVAVVLNALTKKSEELERGCAVQCTVTDSQAIKSFRELRNTARLVYFRVNSSLSNISQADDCHDFEIDKNLGKTGMEFVWASRHTEPFISLKGDLKLLALAISKQLVRHLRISVNCMVMNTTTSYNAVEAVASTLLINVSESKGTVCYKTSYQYGRYHCCKRRQDESGKLTTIQCGLQERSVNTWLEILRFITNAFLSVVGCFYFFKYTFRIFFNLTSNWQSVDDRRQIEVSRGDVMDCLHVYWKAIRSHFPASNLYQAFPWTQRLSQFIYGAVIVPCVFYVTLAFHFAFGFSEFINMLSLWFVIPCFICYFVRQAFSLMPEQESDNQQLLHGFQCSICELAKEPSAAEMRANPRTSHEVKTLHLQLLPRIIWEECKKCTEFLQHKFPSPVRSRKVAFFFRQFLVGFLLLFCFVFIAICRFVLIYPFSFWFGHMRYCLVSSQCSLFDRGPRVANFFKWFLLALSGVAILGLFQICYLTSNFLVHVVVYLVMLLTLDHEKHISYAAGIFLAIYYVCHCIKSLASKYGNLKLVLVKCYTKHPRYKHVRQADQELRIPCDLYMKACDKIEPKATNFLLMLRNLVFFLSFVLIVIACVMIFGPRPGEINSFVKVLITLAIGLAPRVSTLLSSSETDKEKKRKQLKNQVKGFVDEYFQELRMELENQVKGVAEECVLELEENQDERVGRDDIHQSHEPNEEEGGPLCRSFWSKCQRQLRRQSMEEFRPSDQYKPVSTTGDSKQFISSV